MADEKKEMNEKNDRTNAWMIVLREINQFVKNELRSEFNVDVGFKTIDSSMVLSYVSQVAIQRVKQRINSKEQRELFKKLKVLAEKNGIKV